MTIPDLALPLQAYPGLLRPHPGLHHQHPPCLPCHLCHSRRRLTLSHGSVHTCAPHPHLPLPLPPARKLPVCPCLPGRRHLAHRSLRAHRPPAFIPHCAVLPRRLRGFVVYRTRCLLLPKKSTVQIRMTRRASTNVGFLASTPTLLARLTPGR